MDTSRKERWAVYCGVTLAFILLQTALTLQMLIGSPYLYSLATHLIWPERILSLLIIFFIARLLHFFKESNYVLSGPYTLIAANFIVLFDDHGMYPASANFVVQAAYFYYICALFFVKAPEVSADFRKLAMLDIVLLASNYVANALMTMHWTNPVVVQTIPLLISIASYILILLLLNTVRRRSGMGTSIEKDIASIGEPIAEQ